MTVGTVFARRGSPPCGLNPHIRSNSLSFSLLAFIPSTPSRSPPPPLPLVNHWTLEPDNAGSLDGEASTRLERATDEQGT